MSDIKDLFVESLPKITIGIPLRNCEVFIGYTLENILLCDYPRDKIEVVIGNHGSTDHSAEKIQQYAQQMDVKVIDVPYSGPNRAFNRNQILKHATGEILIFIDADILVSEAFVMEHVLLHQKFRKVLVAGYTFGKNPITEKSINHSIAYRHITTSFDILQNNPAYHDYRVMAGDVRPVQGFDVLSRDHNPWILFWTCNVSIKTEDIKAIGNFDENFSGWGLEDDDLAYRCCLHDFEMVFSEKAWVFHMPHEISPRKNYAEKQKNLSYFFNKWQNRELELFNFYGSPIQGQKQFNYELDFYPDQQQYQASLAKARGFLTHKTASRLAFYLRDEKSAELLNLTHCCIPFLDWKTVPYEKGNCMFYSYIGIRTHFDPVSIDETILLLDTVLFASDINLFLLLYECARISRSLIIIHGELSLDEDYKGQLDKFNRVLNMIKFNHIEVFKEDV